MEAGNGDEEDEEEDEDEKDEDEDEEDEDEEDGDPLPRAKKSGKHISLKKELRFKRYRMTHRWPPPESDMEDDDDPDNIKGCEFCVHLSPRDGLGRFLQVWVQP